MILSLIPDPFKLYRESLNRLEQGANALATRHADSPYMARTLLGISRLALGARHVSEQSLVSVYRHLALPSRHEVETIAAAVQRVEDKLDLLLPESAKPARPQRPERSRRPAPDAAEAVAPQGVKRATAKRPASTTAKAKPKPLPQATVQALAEPQLPLKESDDHAIAL
ncbi:hypothetical protein ACIQUS_08555 [Pseudomonas sp. NPDC090755]|uniref:hypothetical protein n=1 Tax=Pseudomonas sp. NPDC090755 TaxID=3364481 RepID=UPI00383A7E3D